MPYFALDYLGFKWPPEMAQTHWALNPNTSGCEPHAGTPSDPALARPSKR